MARAPAFADPVPHHLGRVVLKVNDARAGHAVRMGGGRVGRVAIVVLVGAKGLDEHRTVDAGAVHAPNQVLDREPRRVEPAGGGCPQRVHLGRIDRVGVLVGAHHVGLRVDAHLVII